MNSLVVLSRVMLTTFSAALAGSPAVVHAADAPVTEAPPPVPTIPASVAALVVLAEQGTQLQNLRVRLQANVDQTQSELAASESARAGVGDDATALAIWQVRHDQAVRRVESARTAVTRFDQKTFPAFSSRVDEARKNVNRAWAAGKPTAMDNQRVTEASATLSAAFAAIEQLQNPAAAKNATRSPVPPGSN